MTTEVLEETVVKLKPQEIEIQNIDYLGIVAGIIDSIGIVEIINEIIGVEKGEKVSAGNVLDSQELSNDSILSEYKAQQSCERGFSFLKDPLFFADSIFLKSPEIIESGGSTLGFAE